MFKQQLIGVFAVWLLLLSCTIYSMSISKPYTPSVSLHANSTDTDTFSQIRHGVFKEWVHDYEGERVKSFVTADRSRLTNGEEAGDRGLIEYLEGISGKIEDPTRGYLQHLLAEVAIYEHKTGRFMAYDVWMEAYGRGKAPYLLFKGKINKLDLYLNHQKKERV